MRNKIIILILTISIVVAVGIYCLVPFPRKDTVVSSSLSHFNVGNESRFERQGRNQCSAFSTAYVLRFFGKEASGAQVYKDIHYKVPISGYVLPKGIITYLEANNLNPHIYNGTLDTLKARLTNGNPVIVLVGKNIRWQHYMTLVGYDSEKKELYFFDSGRDKDENGELAGNRTLTEEYFLSMWSNGLPIFNRMYITVK